MYTSIKAIFSFWQEKAKIEPRQSLDCVLVLKAVCARQGTVGCGVVGTVQLCGLRSENTK